MQTGIERQKERKGKKDRREDRHKETGAEVQKRERHSTWDKGRRQGKEAERERDSNTGHQG